MNRLIAGTMFSALLAGCYTLQPAGGVVPKVGTQVAFDVNDAGRLALGGSMGPEIGQIEGRVVQRDSGQYLLSVSAVHWLRGGEQTWAGETVHVKSEYIGSSYLRQFSAGRTIALSAVGLAAVAALAGNSLFGSGSVDQTITPPDSGKAKPPPLPLGGLGRSLRPVRLPAHLFLSPLVGRP
jgi:hypothetical protein